MRHLTALACLCVLTALAGCADPHIPPPQTNHVGPCPNNRVTPIWPRRVIRVFGKHGFSARLTSTTGNCVSAAVFTVGNSPGKANPRYDEIIDAEGELYCVLYRKPIFGTEPKTDLDAGSYSPIYSVRRAHTEYQNVECTMDASDTGRNDEQVARFAAAAEQLASKR